MQLKCDDKYNILSSLHETLRHEDGTGLHVPSFLKIPTPHIKTEAN